MNFKTIIFSLLAGCLLTQQSFGFCGFYVAKADAKLFNKSSQIILVRDGDRTIVTMSNDFQGDVKDFAMVIPVPHLLERNDIRIADPEIFSKLDAYSGPRLVEYHDQNPCYAYDRISLFKSQQSRSNTVVEKETTLDHSEVVIEASYTVGEYDILILSSKESDALKSWLDENDYKVPDNAADVLEPYIKSDMKFFVVKVNLEKKEKSGYKELRPLQISMHSEKFMLPIRLGMANSDSHQDMIVYAFSKEGRIETTNYRNNKIPTDVKIPTFVKDKFGQFYKDVFEQEWVKEGQDICMLEYAWDLSSTNFVKCDPCPTTPPIYSDLREAGVWWVAESGNQWGAAYTGNVFMTRMHLRYDRPHFPQDLQFKSTSNKEQFQGRYIMTHPVQGTIDCKQASDYYQKVIDRREEELENLRSLAAWNIERHSEYTEEYVALLKKSQKEPWFEEEKQEKNKLVNPSVPFSFPTNGLLKAAAIMLLLGLLIIISLQFNRKRA